MKRLSKKEKGFIRDIAKGKTGTQAALDNYDTKDINVAASIASENLSKPKIISALEKYFPDDELYKIHREGLYEENGFIRHKFLETAYKIKGKFKDTEGNAPIFVNIAAVIAKKNGLDTGTGANS